MSVTLEQLRDEFEAARTEFANEVVATMADSAWHSSIVKTFLEWVAVSARLEEPERAALWRDRGQKVAVAAQRYVIARDFGILDEKQAMMVWKLQNGGAL